MTEGWTITQTGFRRETAKAYEGLFTLGSGYLHVRGSLEEPLDDAPQNETYWRLPANVTAEPMRHPVSKVGTYVPGIYARHPLLNNELINLPCFLGLVPSIDGERLNLDRCDVRDHLRTLHLADAVLERSFNWRTQSGATVAVRFERFISAARPHLCLQRLTLTPDRQVRVEIEATIDAGVTTNGFDHFTNRELAPAANDRIRCEVATDSDTVEIASELRAADADLRISGVAADDSGDGEAIALFAHFERAIAGRQIAVEKRTAVTTSRDVQGRSAQVELDAVAPLTWEKLHAEHAAIWKQRWDTCDVTIEGDPASQLAMRMALFHLLRAHPASEHASQRPTPSGAAPVAADAKSRLQPDVIVNPLVDKPLAIDAKGYAGEAYWGRFFWDTEMYLLPFYLYTDPTRARTLVDFRIRTLDGARANARRYGYPGARYAWESDADGLECCPNWQYADHEVHITADVAFALVHYTRATGDASFLCGPAATVLVETARYWMQRIDWRPPEGTGNGDQGSGTGDAPIGAATVGERSRRLEGADVAAGHSTGCRAGPAPRVAAEAEAGCFPDPRSPIPDPSLATPVLLGVMGPDEYTPISDNNAYTNRMVAFALQAAADFGDAGGATPGERSAFADVAARLPIPRSADGSLVLQCDHFEKLAEPNFDVHWSDHSRPFAAQVSQERLYRCKALKQADVLMLMMLFPHEFSDREVRDAWNYYLPYTTHDSSLSAGVHCIIASRLGLPEIALEFWQRASRIDLDVEHGGAAEGIHIANCGAAWQMAVFGFAGLQPAIHEDTLKFAPALPAEWRRLAFPLIWKGAPLYVELDPAGLTLRNRGERAMVAEVYDQRRSIAPGESRSWRTASPA